MGITWDFKQEENVAEKRKMLLIAVLSVIFLVLLIIFGSILVNEKKQEAIAQEIFSTINDLPEPAIESAIEAEEVWEEESFEEYEYYAPYIYYSGSVWYENDDIDSEAEAKEWIAFRESGGDYNSRNGQYIGRYQLSEDKLNGDWSEENQEATADAYVQDRYGSWAAAKEFWERNGWY